MKPSTKKYVPSVLLKQINSIVEKIDKIEKLKKIENKSKSISNSKLNEQLSSKFYHLNRYFLKRPCKWKEIETTRLEFFIKEEWDGQEHNRLQ